MPPLRWEARLQPRREVREHFVLLQVIEQRVVHAWEHLEQLVSVPDSLKERDCDRKTRELVGRAHEKEHGRGAERALGIDQRWVLLQGLKRLERLGIHAHGQGLLRGGQRIAEQVIQECRIAAKHLVVGRWHDARARSECRQRLGEHRLEAQKRRQIHSHRRRDKEDAGKAVLSGQHSVQRDQRAVRVRAEYQRQPDAGSVSLFAFACCRFAALGEQHLGHDVALGERDELDCVVDKVPELACMCAKPVLARVALSVAQQVVRDDAEAVLAELLVHVEAPARVVPEPMQVQHHAAQGAGVLLREERLAAAVAEEALGVTQRRGHVLGAPGARHARAQRAHAGARTRRRRYRKVIEEARCGDTMIGMEAT